MKRPISLLGLIVLTALGMLFSCTRQQKSGNDKMNPEFSNYIFGYTSGMISSTSPIRVRFKQKVNLPDVEPGDELKTGLFKFSPQIPGKAYLEDNFTLLFEPDEPLRAKKTYEAKLNLSEIFEVEEDLEVFVFSFEILEQSFQFVKLAYYPYESGSMDNYYIEGYIETSDRMSEESASKILKAKQGSRFLPVRWESRGNPKKFPFIVDSVIRSEEIVPLVIYYDGSPLNIDKSGTDTTWIPSLSDFELVDIGLVQQPDQYIRIQFSDPLLMDQNLQGLVRLGSNTDLNFEINKNTIKVYPAIRMSGTEEIRIEKGIKNSRGYKLKNEYSRTLVFEDIKPAVRLTGKGVIIPGSQGLIFPFEAVNLRAVDMRIVKIYNDNVSQFLQVNQLDGNREMQRVGRPVLKKRISLTTKGNLDAGSWNAYSVDLADLIEEENGVIYQVELSFRPDYSLYDCGVPDDELKSLNDMEIDQTEFPDWDSRRYYYYSRYPEGYEWSERDNPCHISYYNGNRWVSRNVLASNLGIIAKAGDGKKMHVAVTDLRTARPVANARLDIYNYQQQRFAQAHTNAEGLASIDVNTKPWLLIAHLDEDVGYLKLEDGGALSVSMFDVSGQVVQQGIKGFIYGERGVWRPGDTLFLNFILEDRMDQLPEDHPVSFELRDPQGQLVHRAVKTRSMNGFYKFILSTETDAPTGLWSARVMVGSLRFDKSIRIETVKPNRLKLNLKFDQEKLSVSSKNMKGKLTVNWLHGAVARNLKARVMVTLNTRTTRFEGYEGYTFDDITRLYYPEEVVIFDDKVNDQGKALVKSDLGNHSQSPGMLKANFMVRAFEEGGDFSTDFFSMDYAPFETFVGVKLPETGTHQNELVTDSSYRFKVATLDEKGRPVSAEKLDVEVVKLSWRWWWDISNENLGRYVNRNYEDIVFEKSISTKEGNGSFDLKIEYPNWGRYLVRVTDPAGGHSTSKVFYVDWPSWVSRSDRAQPEGAKIMNITTDKEKYQVGDVATCTYPSGGAGRALVSIEKGAEVVESYWINPSENEDNTIFSIDITPEMAPNIYVSLTHIQPHAQTANDLPIRLYGIKSISVEDPSTKIQPVIEMADVLEPESTFSIKVSEKNNKSMTYTLAVVDEGLLDLTRYKTPDPWSVFYAREALGIKTWDLYDYVLGAYGGKLEQLFAIGGDGSEIQKTEARANRFKPVVMFLGPFELKGDEHVHNIQMPRYVGSVRTMLVAGQNGAYGFAEKTTPVKSPLMILGTLPRVLGPGESVKLPVTVFAMDKSVSDVKLEVETNELLQTEGGSTKFLTFDQPGDKIIYFDLKVPEKTGVGKVKIVGTSQGELASYEIEIEVRNPNPSVTKYDEYILQPGETWDHHYKPVGMEGTNSGLLEISQIPPIDFGKRLKYLTQYPYGCAEQTTSGAFPQLFLEDIMELKPGMKNKITRNIKGAIRRLSRMQHSDGGFRYWPSTNHANDWISSYAGHFLLEAESKGYSLPPGCRKKWLSYQKRAAGAWINYSHNHHTYHSYYQLQQAYRLYTLALAGEPDLASMNRFREIDHMDDLARWRLASTYLLAGKPEVARELTHELDLDVEAPEAMNPTFGSELRDKAMILETLVSMNEIEEASSLVLDISRQFSSGNWYSTQSTAYGLLALAKFAGKASISGEKMSFFLTENNNDKVSFSSGKSISQHELVMEGAAPGHLLVKNDGQAIIYLRLMLEGIPVAGNETSENNRLKINVKYKTLAGDLLDPARIEQGTDFLAEVEVINPRIHGDYTNLALTQIFPSGWEIINTRLAGYSTSYEANKPDYRDIRDDRVYTHFGLRNSVRYVVVLNAAYLGRYYLPAVSCEAMYDNSIYARLAGQWVEVVEPGSVTPSGN